MITILEIIALLAIIILPLGGPGRKRKNYKKDNDISTFVIGADGEIHHAGKRPAKNDLNTTI